MADLTKNAGKPGTLILGIDPGTVATGFGLIERRGSQLLTIGWGAWKPGQKLSRGEKLLHLAESLDDCMKKFRPALVAIEQAFMGRNIQSALRLGEARGAMLTVCARHEVPVQEYATATVKKVVAGNGRASKEQIQFMTQRLLKLKKTPEPEDAADALALALTLALDF